VHRFIRKALHSLTGARVISTFSMIMETAAIVLSWYISYKPDYWYYELNWRKTSQFHYHNVQPVPATMSDNRRLKHVLHTTISIASSGTEFFPINSNKLKANGACKENRILISKPLQTPAEKPCFWRPFHNKNHMGELDSNWL